jgi:hypothetical protein
MVVVVVVVLGIRWVSSDDLQVGSRIEGFDIGLFSFLEY